MKLETLFMNIVSNCPHNKDNCWYTLIAYLIENVIPSISRQNFFKRVKWSSGHVGTVSDLAHSLIYIPFFHKIRQIQPNRGQVQTLGQLDQMTWLTQKIDKTQIVKKIKCKNDHNYIIGLRYKNRHQKKTFSISIWYTVHVQKNTMHITTFPCFGSSILWKFVHSNHFYKVIFIVLLVHVSTLTKQCIICDGPVVKVFTQMLPCGNSRTHSRGVCVILMDSCLVRKILTINSNGSNHITQSQNYLQ